MVSPHLFSLALRWYWFWFWFWLWRWRERWSVGARKVSEWRGRLSRSLSISPASPTERSPWSVRSGRWAKSSWSNQLSSWGQQSDYKKTCGGLNACRCLIVQEGTKMLHEKGLPFCFWICLAIKQNTSPLATCKEPGKVAHTWSKASEHSYIVSNIKHTSNWIFKRNNMFTLILVFSLWSSVLKADDGCQLCVFWAADQRGGYL